MLSPSIAFCPVRVTRLMYFRLWLAASFLDLVSEVILTLDSTLYPQRLDFDGYLLSLAQITAAVVPGILTFHE